MLIRLNLQNVIIRRSFFPITFVILGFLAAAIISEFVVGTLSDKRIAVDKKLLTSTAEYFPASGRLSARLAESETAEPKADFESAEKHLQQAIKLSPNNYKYRLLLAEIRDSRGDRAGAEQAFNDALRAAPNYSEVHWKTANFLVREKRIEDSIEHFRVAAAANPALFAATLDLVSAVSNQNGVFLSRIVQDNQKGRLKLALLLANQSRVLEAADVFSKIDKDILLPAWESASFFDSLINKGFPQLAFKNWTQLKSVENKSSDSSLFWNGDFEADIDSNLLQFDWRIGKSDYARIGLDGSQARSGNRSLMFDFLGRDTTRLDHEAKHLIAVRSGANYRLDFYVKTAELRTDEGPRVVVRDYAGKQIAQSEAVPAGTNDWNRMSVTFTAPQIASGDGGALFISVKRQPRYSYDKPTAGRIWFDDFAITEANGK